MKDFQIEIDSKQIHGVECGEISHLLVVWLYGLTNNALGFTEMANALKENFHVVSIDLLGHGITQSFNDEHSYSFVAMSEWLNIVTTSITSSPVYLLGHSWGCDRSSLQWTISKNGRRSHHARWRLYTIFR